MFTYFTKYLSHQQYSEVYKDIILNLGNVDNPYLFSTLRDDVLNENAKFYNIPDSLFLKLSDEEKITHLNSLRKITRIRKMFRCGYDLSSDEVLLLLQRARTKYEVTNILRSYSIPFAWRDVLLNSNRDVTRFAATEAIEYNLKSSIEWTLHAARLSPEVSYSYYSEYDFEISSLLISKPEYANYVKLNAGNDIKLLCYSMSLLTRDELSELNSSYTNLTTTFKKEPWGFDFEKMQFIYLCLLKYYSNKNHVVFELEKEHLDLYREIGSNNLIPVMFRQQDYEFNPTVKLLTSQALGLYSSKLDEIDYLYVLSNHGVTEELTNRPDFNFEYVLAWVQNTNRFSLTKNTRKLDHLDVKYISFEWASRRVRNKYAKENFYKILPYYILEPTHQYLASSLNLGIFDIFPEEGASCIQDLYDNLTVENYIDFTQAELNTIKNRLTYTFKSKFTFEKGKFSLKPTRLHSSGTPFVCLGFPKLVSWGGSYYISNLFNYSDILTSARSVEDIEKIILVAGSFDNNTLADENFAGDEEQLLVELILEIIKNYNLDKTKTAIALARDWHGTKEDFISMMEVI